MSKKNKRIRQHKGGRRVEWYTFATTMDVIYNLKQEWESVLKTLGEKFGEGIDLQGILFIIGVQELGQGFRKFSKDQKLEVMHIAICTLLEPYGMYEYKGQDKDGWPHWEVKDKLPFMKNDGQTELMQKAIVEYFKENELL